MFIELLHISIKYLLVLNSLTEWNDNFNLTYHDNEYLISYNLNSSTTEKYLIQVSKLKWFKEIGFLKWFEFNNLSGFTVSKYSSLSGE